MTSISLKIKLFLMIRLLVFLGNPGKEYERTRHNSAFMLYDALFPDSDFQMKFHSKYTERNGVKMLRPVTYMNLSGKAVREASAFYRISPEEILVVHDDINLPFGEAKVQIGGSMKGHNGLRNIRDEIKSDSFMRLRIGIGRPVYGDVSLYVTSPFAKNEQEELPLIFQKCRDLLKEAGAI